MQFRIIPAFEVSSAEQAEIANAAFAGYVGGWAEMRAEALARFLLSQGADLYLSRFVRGADERLLGFGYINRTANVLRLAGMAIIPSARGTGAARQLLDHLVDEARGRGDAAMMLEVIEQNPRAVALYRRHGFHEITKLLSWRRNPAGGTGEGTIWEVDEVPVLELLRMPAANEYPAVPWQISRHAMVKLERARAFRTGDTGVIISDPNVAPIRVHGLFSTSTDSTATREVLRAVMNRFPECQFFAPAIWPAELGRDVFEPLGYARDTLSQLHMRLDLSAGA